MTDHPHIARSSAQQRTTGVVLAGGRGLRMRGQDKGLVSLCGQSLASRALAALRPQVSRLMISANRNLGEYAALGVPVFRDPVPGFQGPLAGMLAALRRTATEWLAVVPCDSAMIPGDLVERLYTGRRPADRAAYASAHGNHHYAICLLHRSLADTLGKTISQGQRTVEQFLRGCAAVAVEFEDWPDALCNLNTPADVCRATRLLQPPS